MSAEMTEEGFFRETSHDNGTTTWIVQGNALDLPLPDDSIDLIVTSPPYFSLRSYQDGGEHYEGQIGAEATPAEFVDALIAATREMMRVVKPTGSIWVNLGDKYSGYTNGQGKGKSLMLIPQRYAIRCVDELGLILRAEVIWSKPNGLPESVTDRVRRSHEQWFHFTLNPRYYSAVDEVREPQDTADRKGERRSYKGESTSSYSLANGHQAMTGSFAELPLNPLGKLPSSVWTIATEPLRVPDHLGIDHFAAFPTEWPRRIITGWSPREVCSGCGEGRRPVVRHVRTFDGVPLTDEQYGGGPTSFWENGRTKNKGVGNWRFGSYREVVGNECDCPEPTAPTTPGIVLDPFGGTGTTALVASVLGRDGITVDLSGDYCRLSEWRVSDPKQRKNVETRNASCPKCGAQPGHRCTNGSGKTTAWHKERVNQ